MKKLFGVMCLVIAMSSTGVLSPANLALAADEGHYDDVRLGDPNLPRRLKKMPEAQEGEEFRVGVLKVHPFFESKVVYDDNIRLTDKDEIEDVIFTQAPGVSAEMNLGDHRLELGYGMEFVHHVKKTEENATNFLAHALLEFNFDDLVITIEDNVDRSTSRLFRESSERDRVLINTLETRARYDRPKWAAEAAYLFNILDHRPTGFDNDDYAEHILNFLAGYKIQPHTILLTEADIAWVRYDSTLTHAHQNYFQIFAGIRSEPRDDFSIESKIGWQSRFLSDSHAITDFQEFHGLVGEATVRYRPTDEDAFRVGFVRTIKQSTFSANLWYMQDRIQGSYEKKLGRKLFVEPRLGWQMNSYPVEGTAATITKKRADKYMTAAIEFRYDIQEWLTTGMSYTFRMRNSNINDLDFDSNRFSWNVNLAF